MANHLKRGLRRAGITGVTALVMLGAGAAGSQELAALALPSQTQVQEHAATWIYRAPTPLSEAAREGQRLYLEGQRADGSPLVGRRNLGGGPAQTFSGAQAACVHCHKRSGLGGVEGDILIAPVTGRSLFQPGGVASVMDTRSRKLLNTAHPPYGEGQLALALRQGLNASGRKMHELMPRYDLAEGEVQALDAYLRTLSPSWSPGVTLQRVRLASVITPDVDPALRKVAIDMIRGLVNRKNLGTRPGRRHMVSALEFVLRTERHWEHEIWELTGPAETWAAQLQERQERNPVFAIASGVMRDGAPLHAFCQRERLPCWFPVVEALPASAETDAYGLYFNAGVALEADAMALQMLDAGRSASGTAPGPVPRVLQLVSADASGQRGAAELTRQLAATPLRIALQTFDPQRPSAFAAEIASLQPQDHLALWLRPSDMAALGSLPAPRAQVWSGTVMGSSDGVALPADWRARASLIYPYELPAQRVGNLVGMRSWLNLAKLPLVDEAAQSQLYFALTYLNETLGEMLQNLHRDYLIERAETMLGRRESQTASAEMVAQRSLRRAALDLRVLQEQLPQQDDSAQPRLTQAEMISQREGTTIYPRLNLGPGQRFASKGTWVLPLGANPGEPRAAGARWLIP
jgi:hypothetical protein